MGASTMPDMTRDDGWAVPIVAMIIAFITILSIGGFALSSQAVRESVVVRNESQAFQAASAGIDEAMARLPGGLTGTYTIDASRLGTGTSAVVNVVVASPFSYRVTSTGYAPGGATEQLMTEFTRFDLYGMNVNAGGSGDMFSTGSVGSGTDVYGPFYTGNAITTGHFSEGPLFAGGNVTGGTYTGIADGYAGGTVGVSPFATSVGTFPKLPTLPAIDTPKLQGYANIAKAQSTDNKMGDSTTAITEVQSPDPAGTPGKYPTAPTVPTPTGRYRYGGLTNTTQPWYKFFGPGNGSISAPGEGTTAVTINSATPFFGKGPKQSTSYDDFAWASEFILTVNGTVFIDGPFEIDMPNDVIKYQGNGTIVANGPIHLHVKGFQPFETMRTGGTPEGAHQIFPDDLALGVGKQIVGFVSPTEILIDCPSGQTTGSRATDEDFAGAFYCPAKIQFTGKFVLAGSIITNNMVGPGSGNNIQLRTSPNLKDNVPRAMPGRNDGLVGFTKWVRK
jgi:hypothetical protein